MKKSEIHSKLLIRERMANLIKYMSEGILEKEDILSMTLLCAIAGESIFLLGPPGTAKSLAARRLKMVFKGAKSFEYLMSRFSTPDEIFGPVSISKLKNEDKYERLTDGYLPDASVIFLDKIWKAGPAIQNALLTVINERIYQNGSATIKLPMKALIAASNELPAEDEGLEALWDRFLVRMVSNCISNEKTFFKMIRQQTPSTIDIPDSLLITEDEYEAWHSAFENVLIPDDVCQVVSNVRTYLREEGKKEGANPMDYYISDRRWKKVFHLMQASAGLNGRNTLDLSDCHILIHCLWNKVETISNTLDCVCRGFTFDIESSITQVQTKIDKALKSASAGMSQQRVNITDEADDYEVVRFFYYKMQNFPKGLCLFAKADLNQISTDRDQPGILYYDDKSKCWIIHTIYTGAPFDYKMNSQENVEKIQLRKCQGGIVMNGIPYGFKRKLGVVRTASDLFGGDYTGDSVYQSLQNDYDGICRRWNILTKSLEDTGNLFVSADDKKLVGRQVKKVAKQLEELNVKLINAKQLL